MQAPSRQITEPALRALLAGGTLAGEWILDPRRSSIRLTSRSMGLRMSGVFREVSGHGFVFPDGDARGTLKVAAASIETGIARRDEHLRSAEIFDAGNHPHIIFTADGIRPSGRGVVITGALTVRDHTEPLSFEAAASVMGDGEVWLDADVRINRAHFGLTWKFPGVAAMASTLSIHAVFARR